MTKVLTAIAVAKMRPEAQRREVPDGGCQGLYLVIQPTGRKSWALRYRRPHDGRPAKLSLGPVSDVDGEPTIGAPMTLAGARRLATELKHQVARGVDPGAERRSAGTFGEAVRDFVEHARKKNRSWRATEKLLSGPRDRWEGRAVDAITEDDVFHAVDEARRRGEYAARATHAALSSMFAWLKGRRRVKANPVAGLEKPPAPPARDRVLSDEEVRALWAATERLCPQYRAAIRLMLLTGQRRSEVAGMRRGELDGSTWTIPAARTKNKREHVVPLSGLATEVLAGVERDERCGDHVLSTTGGRTPISGWSKVKRRVDKLAGFSDWRLHDLRRTAVTGMARAGADLTVVERAVNHVSGSFAGVVGTYQKHRYSEEVRRAMEAWANLLAEVVGEGQDNVVRMGAAR